MALSLAGRRPTASRLIAARPRPESAHLGAWLLTLMVAALVVTPVAMLVVGSFSQAQLPTDLGLDRLGLQNYATVYLDPQTYRVAGTTAVYVVATLSIGLTIATAFAWLVARSDMPGRWLALAAIPLSLAIPGMLEAMVWVLLFSPRIGFVNRFATGVLGLPGPPFDVYSLAGMIALESLRLVPTAFLMLLPLCLHFNAALEEAASISGARGVVVARRAVLPLLFPGLLSVGLYQVINVLSSFEVPGIIGLPGHVLVFSTLIYSYTQAAASAGGSAYGVANAVAMMYLAINIVGLWIYERVTRNQAMFAVVTGKGFRPRLLELGRWRWVAFASVLGYLFLTLVLSLLVLAWASLTPLIVQPSPEALGRLTGRSWQGLLSNPQLLGVLRNTLVVVAATASAAAALSLATSWVVVRSRFPGRRLLNQLAFISHGIPGVIMALALVWLWIRLDAVPIYGSVWIIVLGLTTGFLAFGTRVLSAALLQVHTELEEAAFTSGASPTTAVRRVIAPLIAPALAGLWVWVLMQSLRFVSLPLMLETGQANTVLATYLWRQWEAGQINLVAALGLSLVAAILVLSVILGRFGLGPGRAMLLSR